MKQFQLVLGCFWHWCCWCDLPSRLTEAAGKDESRSKGITLFPSQKELKYYSLLVGTPLFSKWEFNTRSPFRPGAMLWDPGSATLVSPVPGLDFSHLHIQILQNTEIRPLVFLLISPVCHSVASREKGCDREGYPVLGRLPVSWFYRWLFRSGGVSWYCRENLNFLDLRDTEFNLSSELSQEKWNYCFFSSLYGERVQMFL